LSRREEGGTDKSTQEMPAWRESKITETMTIQMQLLLKQQWSTLGDKKIPNFLDPEKSNGKLKGKEPEEYAPHPAAS